MTVSHSNLNNNSYSNQHYLDLMPIEPFVQMSGMLPNRTPVDAIITLCNVGLTCKSLKEKVAICWQAFIQYAGTTVLLIAPFSKPVNFSNSDACRNFIIGQFPKLKKWQHIDLEKWTNTTPEVIEDILPNNCKLGVVINHKGNPELWEVLLISLKKVDLCTKEVSTIFTKGTNHYVTGNCKPYMVSTEKWIAMCIDGRDKYSEIDILNLAPDINPVIGFCLHNIAKIGHILQLHYAEGHLYVLCNKSGKCKLLQYDSLDWKAKPKELIIPKKDIFQFYLTATEILFLSYRIEKNSGKGLWQLFACKNTCFADSTPSFVETLPHDRFLMLRATDEGFVTLSRAADSTDENPLVILERLCIGDSEITQEYLQKFSIEISNIEDFLIMHDKIFFLHESEISVYCFDLKCGAFEKIFSPTTKKLKDYPPSLVQMPCNSIELLYVTTFTPDAFRPTGIMKLDFKV